MQRINLNESTLGQEVTSGKVKVTQGDAEQAEAILAMFDALEPTPNLSIPPLQNEPQKGLPKLRSLKLSGDLADYLAFHFEQERKRNYLGPPIPLAQKEAA